MTVSAIGAVGAEPTKAMDALAKAVQNTKVDVQVAQAPSGAGLNIGNSFPASQEVASTTSAGGSQPGFVNSVLDGVYTEIDKLSSKVPSAAGETSPIDALKNDMSSQVEGLSPQAEAADKPQKNEAVEALSKTFDHAIFMAMVNQVVSGVSDTSRTLIKQS